jgi:hypothetical protein
LVHRESQALDYPFKKKITELRKESKAAPWRYATSPDFGWSTKGPTGMLRTPALAGAVREVVDSKILLFHFIK